MIVCELNFLYNGYIFLIRMHLKTEASFMEKMCTFLGVLSVRRDVNGCLF